MAARGSKWQRRMASALLALALIGAAATDDPLLRRQYHLRTVRAVDAWEVGRGAGQVIAVLDTGVDHRHPDLDGRLVEGIDLVDRGTRPRDRNGHGTFVAGIAVAIADNAEGGAGVAPRAKVMPVRVLDDDGMGTSDVVAEGIRWATRRGATVINLSLADVPGQQRSPASLITTDVELAIRQAALEGVVVVAAAGNDGRRRTPYSEGLPALVVGATERDDVAWEHSNYDDETLFAPGVEIISTYVGEPYAVADGTSFAAPVVAAGAALLLQQGADAQATRRRLVNNARPIGAGVGRVDIAAAMDIAPRDRTAPSPRPRSQSDDEPSQEPRQPQPLEPDPDPDQQDDPGDSEVSGTTPTEVTADPPSLEETEPSGDEGAEVPSPIEEPVAADPAALGPEVPAREPSGPPVVPLVVAGVLLFAVAAGVAGQVVARRQR